MSETLLDLRGMRCPWPAIRVARAMRGAAEGTIILAVADDPAAPGEIDSLAKQGGWRISVAESPLGPAIRLIVDKV